MINIPSQFVKHSGPLATGEHRISFDVQPEYASELYNALRELTKTPNGILHFEVVGTRDEAQDALDKSIKEQHNVLNKKIHLLFDKIAEKKRGKSEDVKNRVKKSLIKKEIIKESLSELNFEQQTELINKLEGVLNE